LTGALGGKAVPVRTAFVLYWLVIVAGIVAGVLAAALNA
jgi:hypothetical protein